MEGSIDLEEAMAALDRLSLTVLSLDQYLVILNTKIDVTLNGEPYLSLMLLFDTMSSNFLARIWNRTVASGQVLGNDHLIQLCKNHFNQGRPCVGYLKYGWLSKNMVTNDSVPACHLFLTNNYPKEVVMCPVCDNILVVASSCVLVLSNALHTQRCLGASWLCLRMIGPVKREKSSLV